jgi:ribosomal protein L24E
VKKVKEKTKKTVVKPIVNLNLDVDNCLFVQCSKQLPIEPENRKGAFCSSQCEKAYHLCANPKCNMQLPNSPFMNENGERYCGKGCEKTHSRCSDKSCLGKLPDDFITDKAGFRFCNLKCQTNDKRNREPAIAYRFYRQASTVPRQDDSKTFAAANLMN